MPDYGQTVDRVQLVSGSLYLFPSGTLGSASSSYTGSHPQILAITCSNNLDNKLTKLNNTSSYFIVPVASGSNGLPPQRLIVRYVSASYHDKYGNIDTGSSTINTPTHLLYKDSNPQRDTYINVPLLGNDDGFAVAYKTVNALVNNGYYNVLYSASLVNGGDLSNFSSCSLLR